MTIKIGNSICVRMIHAFFVCVCDDRFFYANIKNGKWCTVMSRKIRFHYNISVYKPEYQWSVDRANTRLVLVPVHGSEQKNVSEGNFSKSIVCFSKFLMKIHSFSNNKSPIHLSIHPMTPFPHRHHFAIPTGVLHIIRSLFLTVKSLQKIKFLFYPQRSVILNQKKNETNFRLYVMQISPIMQVLKNVSIFRWSISLNHILNIIVWAIIYKKNNNELCVTVPWIAYF